MVALPLRTVTLVWPTLMLFCLERGNSARAVAFPTTVTALLAPLTVCVRYVYSGRRVEAGIKQLVGSIGEPFGNAQAESIMARIRDHLSERSDRISPNRVRPPMEKRDEENDMCSCSNHCCQRSDHHA